MGRLRSCLLLFVTGIASVYAQKLVGHRMANGKILHRNSMVVASRTLRFGTCLEIHNRRNHHTVFAVVEDRGPFIKGRKLDLAPAVAKKLGITSLTVVQFRRVNRNRCQKQ